MLWRRGVDNRRARSVMGGGERKGGGRQRKQGEVHTSVRRSNGGVAVEIEVVIMIKGR